MATITRKGNVPSLKCIILPSTHGRGQNTTRESVYEMGSGKPGTPVFKVRVRQEYDWSYPEQTRLVASVWSPVELKWNPVVALPHAESAAGRGVSGYGQRFPTPSDQREMTDDALTLLERAWTVLS